MRGPLPDSIRATWIFLEETGQAKLPPYFLSPNSNSRLLKSEGFPAKVGHSLHFGICTQRSTAMDRWVRRSMRMHELMDKDNAFVLIEGHPRCG